MATSTNVTAPTNRAVDLFYAWAHPIAAFLSNAGWLQQADTGQIVWPASVFNITDANGGGATVTFTGTITNGTTPLRVGSQVKVSGTTNFGTVGTPIVYTITGGNLTTTFTAASATVAHDTPAANTGWATVYVLSTMTSVVGAAGIATYQYTNTDGILCPGQSIVIPQTGTTGFTNAGFNGTFTVLTVTPTAFTVSNGTVASETKTVTGQVVPLPGAIAASEATTTTLPPAGGNYLYEVWKMGDGNGFPVYLRLDYGTTSAANGTSPGMKFTLSAGTDGAGTATGGSTGSLFLTSTSSASVSASTFTSFMSGSTNRLILALWYNTAGVPPAGGIIDIERSHGSSGVDTTSYATLALIQGLAAPTEVQTSITTTSQTTAAIKFPSASPHISTTWSFGSSTLVSPVFPIIGAVGNPMIGFLIGAKVDWTDATQFSFTMYNTARNYLVINQSPYNLAAGVSTNGSDTCMIAIRYD